MKHLKNIKKELDSIITPPPPLTPPPPTPKKRKFQFAGFELDFGLNQKFNPFSVNTGNIIKSDFGAFYGSFCTDSKIGWIMNYGFYYENLIIQDTDNWGDIEIYENDIYSVLLELGFHIGSSIDNPVGVFFDATWVIPFLQVDVEEDFKFININKNFHLKGGFFIYDVLFSANYRLYSHSREINDENYDIIQCDFFNSIVALNIAIHF